MKTVRQSTFETNSSSTHAYSLVVPSNFAPPAYSFVDKEIEVKLGATYYIAMTPRGRLEFLLSFAYLIGDQAAFDKIRSVIEAHSSCTIKTLTNTGLTVIVKSYENDDERNCELEEAFYKFTYDENDSIESLIQKFNQIVAKDANIISFVFSEYNPIDQYEHYDG
jgi:hypothetical protein